MTDPCNMEAERAVLGAVFLGENVLPLLVESGLRPEHFYWEKHADVYAAMQDVGGDVILLSARLRGTVNQADIEVLASSVPAVGRWPQYARLVIDYWELRQFLRAAHRVIELVEARDLAGLQGACRWFAERVQAAPVVSLEEARARRSA